MKKQFFTDGNGKKMVREIIKEYQASTVVTNKYDGSQREYKGEWDKWKDIAAQSLIRTINLDYGFIHAWTRSEVTYEEREREIVREPNYSDKFIVATLPSNTAPSSTPLYDRLTNNQSHSAYGGWDLH